MTDHEKTIEALHSELEETYRAITQLTNELEDTREKLEQLGLYDELTGLPNRTLYRDRFENARAVARRENKRMAIFVMDLDRFKDVNDTLGHDAGDTVLKVVSNRIRRRLRDTDTMARIGGDEFAFLLPMFDVRKKATIVAKDIIKLVQQPVAIGSELVDIDASIGIALFPDHGQELAELQQCADVAMYQAKTSGGGFALYEGNNAKSTGNDQALSRKDLGTAIGGDQLVFHYQPKIDLRSSEICGCEALMRWPHPGKGLLMPDDFVHLAERGALTKPFTEKSLVMAFEQIAAWREGGWENSVAVNLAPRNLHNAELIREIVSLLQSKNGLVEHLVFEVSESALMIDADKALETLNQFASLGVRISIDNFGTGFSSFSYLSQLPIQEVKIDRSFVRNMNRRQGDFAIVRSLIDLANNLDITVAAEGVERYEDLTILTELGCHLAQGYAISYPLPAHDLVDWKDQWYARNPPVAEAPVPLQA